MEASFSSTTAVALCLTRSSRLSLCPQSDVVQQSVYNLVHVDDRETFKRQLQFSHLEAESKNSTCTDLLVSQSAEISGHVQ